MTDFEDLCRCHASSTKTPTTKDQNSYNQTPGVQRYCERKSSTHTHTTLCMWPLNLIQGADASSYAGVATERSAGNDPGF